MMEKYLVNEKMFKIFSSTILIMPFCLQSCIAQECASTLSIEHQSVRDAYSLHNMGLRLVERGKHTDALPLLLKAAELDRKKPSYRSAVISTKQVIASRCYDSALNELSLMDSGKGNADSVKDRIRDLECLEFHEWAQSLKVRILAADGRIKDACIEADPRLRTSPDPVSESMRKNKEATRKYQNAVNKDKLEGPNIKIDNPS